MPPPSSQCTLQKTVGSSTQICQQLLDLRPNTHRYWNLNTTSESSWFETICLDPRAFVSLLIFGSFSILGLEGSVPFKPFGGWWLDCLLFGAIFFASSKGLKDNLAAFWVHLSSLLWNPDNTCYNVCSSLFGLISSCSIITVSIFHCTHASLVKDYFCISPFYSTH